MGSPRGCAASWSLAFVALIAIAELRAEIAIAGRVTNENNTPVAGARVVVSRLGGPAVEALSDQTGAFTCQMPDELAEYRLTAERAGYFRLENYRILPAEGRRDIHIVLTPLREVYESIDVSASAERVGIETAAPRNAISGAEMLSIPFPASNNLKNALRVMPGVVQDAKAGIHVNGSPEEQVLFTLDGFTLNDPLTGRLESRVGVESVQSVEIGDGRIPAEFGRGAAGVVAINTATGDDAFRYTATNFFPGIETAKRIYVGNWSPRVGLSGPIRKGRAWFSDTASMQYTKQVLPDLPEGADEIPVWRFNNLLRGQVNLTPSQILQAGLLFNGWWAPNNGLNELTPAEATTDKQSRQWFAHVRHQAYLPNRVLLEIGYAANRSYGREIPQGNGFLRVTPEGYSGNATLTATRQGGRDQWLATMAWPGFTALGGHQLKMGADISRSWFEQEASRSGIEYYSRGRLLSAVAFGGPAHLSQSNLETSVFVQDGWKWTRRFLFEAGVRSDRDRLVGTWNVSPRLGIAWTPASSGATVIRAGFAVVYEPANLRLFTRPLDQYSLATYYAADGSTAGVGATVFTFGERRAANPRARNWSVSAQQALAANLDLYVRYTGRRGQRGFTYINQLVPGQPAPPLMAEEFGVARFDAIYAFGNQRRDVYDAIEITLRQSLRRQYGWMASYMRSRTASNAALDIDIADPIRVLNNVGPMPWDSPHRFVGWSYLPLFWKNWASATMVEARTGFPYSTQNANYAIEALNGRRFPFFFEWNQHLERRFVLRGHRWEFRGGLNNITNHYNPNVVNTNPESSNFLRYYGGQRRVVNFRIRWLGRAEARRS